MPRIIDSMFKISARTAEMSLLMMESAMRAAQTTVDRLAGLETPALPVAPPVNGPTCLDEATSDLSNRLFRLLWEVRGSPSDLLTIWDEVVSSARMSFAGLEFKDARQWMALPVRLPLSFGSLLAQQSLRGIYATYAVGPDRVADFTSYLADNFTDIHVYLSLRYKDLLTRLDERLEKKPNDAWARLQRARTFMNMGLYPDAAREFRTAAEDPDLRAAALRDSAVANYRAGRYRESIDDGVAALASDPSSRRGRYWLWLAAQRLDGYPDTVPESARAEVRAGRMQPRVDFEEVSSQIGLDKTSGGRGTAIFDLDGDGYLDVVVASSHGGRSVYRNNGDGTFSDVSVGSGVDECVNCFVVAVGDYDNDGRDDLYITRLGFYQGDSVLYRNNGDGTFTDVTAESGVGCWGPAYAAQWVDYDCDGNLDLFVCSNLGGMFDRTARNRLFHNNGDGTFTDVSMESGINTISPTIGGCWGDYDNDGYPDLFVSSALGRSKLFRNNGDGTFTDVSGESGLDDICLGTVAFWCDYDNDGWLDLVQFTWSPEDDVLDTLFDGEGPAHGKPMRVFHNNGDGTFTLETRELGISGCFGTMSGNPGDFDNDGYLDFLMGNGDPHVNRTEPAIILEFDPEARKYRNVTFAAGLPYTGKTHGSNMADLAGDGRLSLILASGGLYPGDLMTMSVFRPKRLPGNYLNVRLVGTKSNRNAVGARVRLDAGGRSRHLLVSGGSSFGCLPYEQHFGLGKLDKADALEIWWPSGARQVIGNLPVNTTIRIVEGVQGWSEIYRHGSRHAGETEVAGYARTGTDVAVAGAAVPSAGRRRPRGTDSRNRFREGSGRS